MPHTGTECELFAEVYADVKHMVAELGATDVLRSPPVDTR